LITTLDTTSWAPNLVTGNAEFVESPSSPTGTLYVVSNVRSNSAGTFGSGFGYNFGENFGPSAGGFVVLESTAVPPAPGPGSTFITRASYNFPQPNQDFDPVVAIDVNATPNPVLHIIGTRNTPTGANTSSQQLTDLIKFTFDTVTYDLTGPIVLSTGARIRGSYDIAVLSNSDTIVAACLAEPIIAQATITSVSFGGVTATITATSIASNVLTVTATNSLVQGQQVLLDGLTTSTFLNGQVVTVLAGVTNTQFTAIFPHANYPTTPDTGTASPAGVLTLTTVQPASQFAPGQWLLLNGLTNATWLNGQLIQVLTVDGVITAYFLYPGVYPPTADTGTAVPVGDSLLTMELDTNSVLVPGSPKIIASSPPRTGNAYDAVSLVTANSLASGFGAGFGFNFGNAAGSDIELYYESHPKNVTFVDQVFTINLVNRLSDTAITATALSAGGILTVTANNNFVPGTLVTFENTQESFLNGATVTVVSANGTSFTAQFIVPQSPVDVQLASAVNFSLLASSTITNVGATVLTGGNLGLYPGNIVTGITPPPSPNFTPPATEHIADALAQQAQIDATTAWGYYFAQPEGTQETVRDGLTLTPGTYTSTYPGFGSEFGLSFGGPGTGSYMILHTGQTLTLNGAGTYIFQIGSVPGFGQSFGNMFGGSSLSIEAGATINLTGGATADNIIWVVDGSVSIGSGAAMVGSVVALNNIVMDGGTLDGRAISLSGAINITSAETINTESSFTEPPYSNPTDTGTATPAEPTWDTTATVLTTFSARYADNRLTVIPDTSGNRYLSQTYWSQQNHPEGIIGNVLLGYATGGVWAFHPTLGSTMGGSIIQGTISVDLNLNVSLSYLLQPFQALPAEPSAVAWPFHVASVAIPSLGVTEVPGFYNALNFTWLRGTKSLVDNDSVWAVVGEREVASQVTEAWTIPTTATPTILPAHAASFEDNVSVVYTPTNTPLVQVLTENPAQGQYYVEDSSGLYVFNVLDGGATISITYNAVSGVVPVYASLFNVPPIAAITPPSVVLWRDTTYYATDVSAITSFSITNNIVTALASNDFVAGDQVAIFGFRDVANAFLNGNTLTVLTATSTQFTAAFTHANYTYTSGAGFGFDFGEAFGGTDFGFAAVLIPGPFTVNACGSYSPNSDPLTYVWTDNYPVQSDVTIMPSVSGCSAVVTVNPLIGGAAEQFNVGVSVLDIGFGHIALVPTSFSINADVITLTVPNDLVAGEQVMPYDIALAPPAAPDAGYGNSSFGYDFGSNFGGGTTYYFQTTYVNSQGETTASAETLATIPPNVTPAIMSPPPNGDATSYNVYASLTSGGEQLQFNSAGNSAPTPIGTNWSLAPGGLLQGTNPPTVNTAFEQFLNDIDLTLMSSSPTGFVATPQPLWSISTSYALGNGVFYMGETYTSLQNNNVGNLPSTSPLFWGLLQALPNLPTTTVVGFVMPQFQYAITNIIVPENIAPTITFPAPNWSIGPFVDVARNQLITITPNYPLGAAWSNTTLYQIGVNVVYLGVTYTSIQDNNVGNVPSTSPAFWTIAVFPVVYTGLTDPDDTPTYQWTQLSGTTVTVVGSSTLPSFSFQTNGVNINGESLVFSLTVNDGINPPVTQDFTVDVAAYVFNPLAQDTLQLSRSIYASTAAVTNVSIFEGIGVITALNNFSAGQTVFFDGMQNATFLNGATFTVLPTGFGQSFGAGFGGDSVTNTQFTIVNDALPNFNGADTGFVYAAQSISQRNAYLAFSSAWSSTTTYAAGSKISFAGITYISLQSGNVGNNPSTSPAFWATVNLGWSPLDISIIFNNLNTVKRTSILDGSDRYIAISPYSVLVYGVFPFTAPAAVLMRKLFLPNNALIVDAVHTEQDYTLVLDSEGNIWRYTTAPFINTDNPDTQLVVSNFTSLNFADTDDANDVKILTTVSFGGQRVLVLAGEQGAFLMQVNTNTLAVSATMTLDVASNFVYGASKIQFVRWVDMDSLRTGRILIGSILNQSAQITSVSFSVAPDVTNTLRIVCSNTFTTGDVIVLSGLTNAPELNGLVCEVISATGTYFLVSYQPPTGSALLPSYGPTADTGLAQSQNSGSTFETLIDLGAGQIIGTFDKSKLRNQFVETGEIMFDPDDTYAGGPAPPALLVPTEITIAGQPFVEITWQQNRPDLINSYTVQYAVENPIGAQVPATAPFTFQLPPTDEFTADEGVFDTTANFQLQVTSSTFPFPGQYNATSAGLYTFNPAQAGDTVVITIRQAFQNLEIVNSGNVQTIYVPLSPGRTYFFQVQATGLDGTSGFSNIQQITI
jgi:Ice-binding-like